MQLILQTLRHGNGVHAVHPTNQRAGARRAGIERNAARQAVWGCVSQGTRHSRPQNRHQWTLPILVPWSANTPHTSCSRLILCGLNGNSTGGNPAPLPEVFPQPDLRQPQKGLFLATFLEISKKNGQVSAHLL